MLTEEPGRPNICITECTICFESFVSLFKWLLFLSNSTIFAAFDILILHMVKTIFTALLYFLPLSAPLDSLAGSYEESTFISMVPLKFENPRYSLRASLSCSTGSRLNIGNWVILKSWHALYYKVCLLSQTSADNMAPLWGKVKQRAIQCQFNIDLLIHI